MLMGLIAELLHILNPNKLAILLRINFHGNQITLHSLCPILYFSFLPDLCQKKRKKNNLF